jgi:hypothetical protein
VDANPIIRAMNGVGLFIVKPSRASLRAAAAWAVVLGLLINVATIMPLMLGMAVADTAMPKFADAPCPMNMPGMGAKAPIPTAPPCDHAHCLICQGGLGPAVLGAALAPVAVPLRVSRIVFEHRIVFVSQPFRTSYISRAPPLPA